MRKRRSILARASILMAAVSLSLPAVAPSVVRAGSTIVVTTVNQETNADAECSLQEAIHAANRDASTAPNPSGGADLTTGCAAGSGTDTIELPPGAVFTFADPINDAANFAGPAATPIITSSIVIEGRGARLERLAAGRLTRAFVIGATGALDLREVHLKGFAIRGGDGGAGGGGGGLGAGGAIYVQGGSLRVRWSTFEGNGVRGGDGGDGSSGAGGGGGGLSGDGGTGFGSGGGGGGSRGDGGIGRTSNNDFWGGGGGGRVTSGSNEDPGQPCGGAGGESTFAIGGDGDSASPFCAGGGGGGGSGTSDLFPGHGGNGSYGGGGGGGGTGPGLTSGDGGDGGFGGGGGGAPDNEGGDGGFGAGGGAGFEVFSNGRGQGGTFGGDGSDLGTAGGGGAGLGGAIFGYLADIDVENSTFVANTAERGRSGIQCGLDACAPGANDGRGAGGAIFTVAGALTVQSSTLSGNWTGEYNLIDGVKVGLGGGAIVVYDPEGDDEATLVLRNTIIAGNDNAECYTRNGVTTSGSQGNIIVDSSVNTRGDVPCPGVISAVDPGLGVLALNPPGRTPTMAIADGSSAVDVAVGATPTDDQRGIPRPQGAVADVGAFELSNLPPATTITFSPVGPDGSNGWYVTAVGVTVAGTDPDGTVAETRCVLDPAPAPTSFSDLPDGPCVLTSVSADGTHVVYAASKDDSQNEESPPVSASFQLDATAPSLAPSLSVASPILVGQSGVTASPGASDATSGVAASSCGTVDTATPGVHEVICTATDHAGNQASATLTYVVEYRILGFFSPVPGSKWKVGQTVPVKVALADAGGTRIPDAEAAALAAACRVTFAAAGVQSVTNAPCLKYDAASDQFVYNWKLAKRPVGAATISVAVAYPGSDVRTVLSAGITITR